jgi:plastocyanin domain-containing protein
MRNTAYCLGLVAIFALCSSVGGCKGEPPKPAGTGKIPITADDKGFNPSSVTVQKGAPASLVFTRTSDDTCANKVVFPELKIEKELPKNTPVAIDIPTDKEQKLTFQCGMGMYKSTVVVAAR